MGKLVLVGRLAARDLGRRKAQAVLLLLAITAASATLALALALHGVTSHPYEQTRAATKGPDAVAQFGETDGPHGPGQANPSPQVAAQVAALLRAPGVTGHSGPYPVAGAVLRARGTTSLLVAEGRDQAAASVDQPALTSGGWVRPGGVVLERTFAEALRVGVGDRVTLNGRPYRVAGIAVTAATPPYPNLCYTECLFNGPTTQPQVTAGPGLAWVTRADARVLASSDGGPTYILNLRLSHPARAPAFARRYDETRQGNHPSAGSR